ncbi:MULTISPECIES: hypothetical protein [unclassified Burkholderia]|uniref:hypothetical protein n=1 Tax=unclassified Burkholderia TaxID=2613784 RepID=UPI0015C5BE0B|nr:MULTISPECIES: hypothetical protein [unclassified Burkholderia]
MLKRRACRFSLPRSDGNNDTRATCFAHWLPKQKSDTSFDASLFFLPCARTKKVAWLAATAA